MKEVLEALAWPGLLDEARNLRMWATIAGVVLVGFATLRIAAYVAVMM